jgi:rSAM/selenodomain-associated transferase 1
MDKHLIVYAKRPLPRYAKTRLGKAIGIEASAGIYARLLYRYLFDLMDNLKPDIRIELSVASPEDVNFFKMAFPEFIVRPQVDGNLGVKMAMSMQQAFEDEAKYVVLTGSDIPGLTSDIVTQAFTYLESHQGVIGPAADGGYYLIGLRSSDSHLFTGITWSTHNVMIKTEQRAKEHGIKLMHLPTLVDMDDVNEYTAWSKKIKLT